LAKKGHGKTADVIYLPALLFTIRRTESNTLGIRRLVIFLMLRRQLTLKMFLCFCSSLTIKLSTCNRKEILPDLCPTQHFYYFTKVISYKIYIINSVLVSPAGLLSAKEQNRIF
jgi:hypothetical protein